MADRTPVLTINFDKVTFSQALVTVIGWGRSRNPHYVCFANVHMLVEAYHNNGFADQVNNASLVLTDGMPLVKLANLKSKFNHERVAGMDFMPELIKEASRAKLKFLLFGGSEDVLEKIKKRIEEEFLGVVVDSISPPFNRVWNNSLYVERINNSGANFVFVALGCPKQEIWMAENSPKINAVLLGVGGAFPVFAKVTKRAPLWMRQWSLEWLFRLVNEPKRLFKRYLLTNSLFIYLVLKQEIDNIFKQK